MTAYGRAPNDGVIRLRWAGRAKVSTGQLSVPVAMARAIPPGARFRAEWHDDGILYRFLGVVEPAPEPFGDEPGWATKDGAA